MAIGSPQWMYASGEAYEIDQSLKFDQAASSNADAPDLTRTFTTPTSDKISTLSAWVKRAELGGGSEDTKIFGARDSGGGEGYINFNNNDKINIYFHDTGVTRVEGRIVTTQVFRDPSAFYHIVVAIDTTQGTASNRMKLYVNGEQVTELDTNTQFDQNDVVFWNRAISHYVGERSELYLAEMHFIDGQQLTPASFGETGDYGEWKPIEYSGTYGTNGFYLPFKQDYTVEGFSTVTYKGNESTMYVGGTGFQPDLVWFKQRDGTRNHTLIDSVRGGTKQIFSSATTTEETYATAITSFDTDGFTIGSQYNINEDNKSMVAWCWDMGGSNASNTNGSITSTVRANPTYGQSIVSYVGNATAGATVGHGLSSAPEMIIIFNRDRPYDSVVWHDSLAVDWNLRLSSNVAQLNSGTRFNSTDPSSTVFTLGSQDDTNGVSGANDDLIAYCFHSVTGYSKIGSYTGNGSNTGTIVTTGFRPAFLLLKNTEAAGSWYLYDSVREPADSKGQPLYPNNSNGNTSYYERLKFTNTGFQLLHTDTDLNGNGTEYIYMAFADKREYAYWLDQSGNNNDWTSNNLTESDISVDSPTNNFATLNPLDAQNTPTISEGNLKLVQSSSYGIATGTIAIASGKYYWEVACPSVSGTGENESFGISKISAKTLGNTYLGSNTNSWALMFDNASPDIYFNYNNSFTDSGVNATAGDIFMFALDSDTGKLWFGRNGTWFDSGNPASGTNEKYTATVGSDGVYYPVVSNLSNDAVVFNFGQDSSFAGNKTAQGNQDGNNIGDFYYTPPTGFLALCTKNLPDVDVVPSEHFNTVLYTGTGSSNAITGVGFQPDFTWLKRRNGATSHRIMDAVRTATKYLSSNVTNAEDNTSGLFGSFDSDGFTVTGTANAFNGSSQTYVAWNWKANGSGSSNTDGDITSTVSANVDAGFSIVSYTGNGSSNQTVGHGLSQDIDMVIVKNRSAGNTDNWRVWHTGLTSNTYFLGLNQTSAQSDSSTVFNGHSSSTFTIGNDTAVNNNGDSFIAYCFHSVDGYSKVGSYTGNGNADGTFVYTGFRPAWVMIKYYSGSGANHWWIWDSGRNTFNPVDEALVANLNVSTQSPLDVDFTSNGFKFKTSNGEMNGSGTSYIYLAFAESPFKYSNAR